MSSKIYFDNAATGVVDKSILEAFNKAIELYPGNPSSIHKYGQEAIRIIDKSRMMILNALGLRDHEVIYTSGATEANNLALKGYCLSHKNRGNHIIISEVEHPSILETARQLEREFGFEVTYVKINSEGKVTAESVKEALKENTILVSIMAVNNEIGSVNDIENIALLLKDYPKIVFHVDGVQALGKIAINYSNPDMITFTGHKVHGLIGSGCLLVRKGITLEPIISGGGQESGLRSGTLSLPLISTFAIAVKKACENQAVSYKKVKILAEELVSQFNQMSDILVINSNIKENPFVVNISLKNHKASVVVEALSNRDIYVSSISACHSSGEPVSYVVEALRHDYVLAHNTIRISFDPCNTLEEVAIFIKEFKAIIGEIKQWLPTIE